MRQNSGIVTPDQSRWWKNSKLLCMSTLSFRLRFQPGIVFFQEPNVHQAAGLSVAYPLESDVEGLPRFHQGNAQSLSCGAQILPRRPFDFERVAQRPEHLAGDVALEAPDGLLLGFSVALALSVYVKQAMNKVARAI